MEANELRIGNFIMTASSLGESIETAKFFGNIVTPSIMESIQNGVMFAKPIPLTEEWQLILGYEGYGIFWNSDGDKSDLYDFEHIKYVHQFQNLWFVLRDEEIKINESIIRDIKNLIEEELLNQVKQYLSKEEISFIDELEGDTTIIGLKYNHENQTGENSQNDAK